MVAMPHIGRKLARKRAHKPLEYSPQNEPPMTGAQAIAYWKRTGARGVYADRRVYPQDSPELARELRRREEARE